MGILSEISEEQEQRTHLTGILIGIFFPITFPYITYRAYQYLTRYD